MTCKVRRDFKIITDVSSRVSLVTSNIRASSICSPKSLYQKISNEILRELKAAFKTGESKVPRPLSVTQRRLGTQDRGCYTRNSAVSAWEGDASRAPVPCGEILLV